MREDEGRLVLNVQVAAKLQGAMAFRAVHEDGDGKEQGADRQLAASEDGLARPRELMLATPAFPALRSRKVIGRKATALGANGVALGLGPADHAEAIVRLLIRKPGNPSEAQAPCGFGEEEVLHLLAANVFRWCK